MSATLEGIAAPLPTGYQRSKRLTTRRWLKKWVLPYVLVTMIVVPFFFPFYWMIRTSLMSLGDATSIPPLLVFAPTLDNYVRLLSAPTYWKCFANSAVIGILAMVIGLLAGLPAAYSIARFRQRRLSAVIMFSRMCPHIGILVPWFIFFTKLKLADTFAGMVMTHLIITLPLTIWIMIGFFEEIPQEIQDAAMVDGCSTFGTFVHICVPVVLPGIVVSTILGFAFSWNNFLLSAIIGGPRTQTLPVITYLQVGEFNVDWGYLASSGIALTVPVLLLTMVVQRYLIRGLAFGGSKG
jgi:multiple sugar transport system permease protein